MNPAINDNDIKYRKLRMKLFSRWASVFIVIASAFLYGIISPGIDPEIRETRLLNIVTNGNTEATNYLTAVLPYSVESSKRLRYIFEGTIFMGSFSYPAVKIVPDDYIESVRINDAEVSLKPFPESARSDFVNGILLQLKNYLKPGENHFSISILDRGKGRAGIRIENAPVMQNPFRFIIVLLLAAILLFFIAFFLYSFIKDKKLFIIVLAGIAVHLFYLYYTPFDKNTYDILEGNTGHINYIEYIVNNRSLPRPDRGWEYHQPPLYYVLSAVLYFTGQNAGIKDLYKMLQGFSFICYLGFLYFGIRLLSRLIPDRKWIYICAALLCFWPSGFINGARIGNDDMVYLFTAAFLYYAVVWREENSLFSWAMLLLSAVLNILTKSSGLILFAVTGSILLIRLYEKRNLKDFLKKAALAVLLFSGAFILPRISNLYYALNDRRSDWYMAAIIIDPSNINNGLRVGNKLVNYTYFDFPAFAGFPYISTWTDEGGRQYFWNFLLKSSLFGEFFFPSPYHQILSFCLSILLLLLTGYFIAGIIIILRGIILPVLKARKRFFLHPGYMPSMLLSLESEGVFSLNKMEIGKLDTLLIYFIIALASMIVLRIRMPFSCLADFRYIFPVLLPIIAVIIWLLDRLRKSRMIMLYYFGVYSALAFSILGGMFFLIPG